jgi:glycosyltransferase involved in cell wall biosynthesis
LLHNPTPKNQYDEETSQKQLVSIIIPTKNSESYLNECLTFIKQQTHPNIETIIVDSYSKDNTQTMAQTNNTIFIQQKGTAAKARNTGIKQSKGKYIFLLDADHLIPPNTVKTCIETIQKNNIEALILPEKSITTSSWGKIIAFEHNLIAEEPSLAMPRFFKAEVLTQLGEDENLVFGEDWDLYQRFKKQHFKAAVSTEHILHKETNSLSKILIKNIFYGRAFKKLVKKQGATIYRRYTFLPVPTKKFIKHTINHPSVGAGFIFLRFFRILFFLIGVTTSFVRKDNGE